MNRRERVEGEGERDILHNINFKANTKLTAFSMRLRETKLKIANQPTSFP